MTFLAQGGASGRHVFLFDGCSRTLQALGEGRVCVVEGERKNNNNNQSHALPKQTRDDKK